MHMRLSLLLVRSIGPIFKIFLKLFMISEGKKVFEGSKDTKYVRKLNFLVMFDIKDRTSYQANQIISGAYIILNSNLWI